MSFSAPTSFHLDLYRYWLNRRGCRLMPSRKDIDPAEIAWLLPNLCLLEKIGGVFHYRLVGTNVVRQLGGEVTGRPVGTLLSKTTQSGEAVVAILERVFSTAHPLFAAAQYKTGLGAFYEASSLVLPLSCTGTQPDMIISSRVARYPAKVSERLQCLAGASAELKALVEIDSVGSLERRCIQWERECRAVDTPEMVL